MQRVLQQFLMQHAEEPYKRFNKKIIPNETRIVGVRTPILRDYAKGIVKSGKGRQFLIELKPYYYEEHLVYSFVLGFEKMSIEEKLLFTKQFIPYITNWSICDSFCAALKDTKKHLPIVWLFLEQYYTSKNVYDRRFATVMLLNYYVTEDYIDEVLTILASLKNDDYYIMMAIAWAVSICYIKLPEKTYPFLLENTLDDATHNKVIQKIMESTRISKDTKLFIKTLRRQKRS